jgi:hypothetical protein
MGFGWRARKNSNPGCGAHSSGHGGDGGEWGAEDGQWIAPYQALGAAPRNLKEAQVTCSGAINRPAGETVVYAEPRSQWVRDQVQVLESTNSNTERWQQR